MMSRTVKLPDVLAIYAQIPALDRADFVKTTAVFLMLFIFISIVCMTAVIVIAYTRCMTIALINRQVYDDLRHLGASRAYLRHSVREQVKRVFFVPIGCRHRYR